MWGGGDKGGDCQHGFQESVFRGFSGFGLSLRSFGVFGSLPPLIIIVGPLATKDLFQLRVTYPVLTKFVHSETRLSEKDTSSGE